MIYLKTAFMAVNDNKGFLLVKIIDESQMPVFNAKKELILEQIYYKYVINGDKLF